MIEYSLYDINGNRLKKGDRVRVIAVPVSTQALPDEAKEAFSSTVGNEYNIDDINDVGWIEIETPLGTLWFEAVCLKRIQCSEQTKNEPTPASESCVSIVFDITLPPEVDAETFGTKVIQIGYGGSFSYLPNEQRIKGSLDIELRDVKNIQTILKQIKKTIYNIDNTKSIDLYIQ